MRPEDKLLPLLRNVVEDGPGRWRANCPIHEADSDNHDPSLRIETAVDGKLLLHCFVCGDEKKAVHFCMAVGLLQSDLYPESASRFKGSSKKKNDRPKNAKRVAEYNYRDAQGAILYRAVRYEWPVEGKEKPEKDFVQQRPDGEGGWIPGVKGVNRVLYKLPELIAADKSATVFFVEGEKKVELLQSWGLVATCNVGGAEGKWNAGYTESLAGRNVVILPDNDPIQQTTGKRPSFDWAIKILKTISGIAATVRIIELPGLPLKGDIVDWAAAGHGLSELLEIVSKSTDGETEKVVEQTAKQKTEVKEKLASIDPADPALLVRDREILASIRLDVLGELGEGKAKVFSETCRKSAVLDIDRITYDRLMLLCGPIFRANVQKGNGDDGDDRPTLTQVRNAIAAVASTRQITDHDEVGVGCWTGLTDDLKEADSIILVGAGEAAKWNGTKKLEKILRPRVGGLLLELGAAEHWYDYERLSELMQQAGDPLWAYNVVIEAESLFSRWRWRNQETTPKVIVGLILATWVQTIFSWRPLVAVTGKSNSGKSTLFEALDGIFGNLALKSSRSSAAGIRQAVKRSAAVVMVDEFEAGRNREESLEMFRASSRGDKVLRGTTGHKGMEFTLRHIVWVAAIESGLVREPDRNRFITVEAQTPTAAMAGKLILPAPHVLNDLGSKLLAVAVRNALSARELAVKLKVERFEGIHPRVVESYAVPAAMYAGVQQVEHAEAVGILRTLLETVDGGDSTEGDEETLIGDILSSSMRLDKGVNMTVSQAIGVWAIDNDAHDALQRHGVDAIACAQGRKVYGEILTGDYVFIAHNVAKRELLKGTAWSSQSIDQILMRMSGARRIQWRIAKMVSRGVLIPMESVAALNDDDMTS